jgi:hypothetical protein
LEVTTEQLATIACRAFLDNAWFDISMGLFDVDAILEISPFYLNTQLEFLRRALQPVREFKLFDVLGSITT